jgi:hypothetical protein
LSPTIDVSGQLEDGKFFKFCLTREIGSVKELSESTNRAWEDFNDSQSETPPSDFTTQFRYLVEDDAVDAVAEGLEMLKRCAPFVIVFNQEFFKIDITTPDKKVSFKVVKSRHLQEDGLQEITVNEIFTKILVATSGDLSPISEFVQDLEDDEDLLPHLAERRKQRQIGRENHHLGQQVEESVKDLLEDNDFAVCRTGTGSDYRISIGKEGQSWLVEVKATRDQGVRMTAIQAKTAVEQGEKFLLCVVPVESEESEPELDIVRENMRFVENIGPLVDELCRDLNGFEELRDEITANESSGVRLEIEAGAAGVRVASSVWEEDGFRLEDLAEHLK